MARTVKTLRGDVIGETGSGVTQLTERTVDPHTRLGKKLGMLK